MASALVFIISVLAAYLIGSFPASFVLAKVWKGVDIRETGSGNVGATNVFRVAGKLPGLVALAIDILKGVLVVTILTDHCYKYIDTIDYEFYRPFMGLAAISGHIWPVFLKFKGGKGIATTMGVSVVLMPLALLSSFVGWSAVFYMTSYVSLSSIAMVILLPIFSALFYRSIFLTIFAVTVCMITIYKHRSNIKRLLEGKESKAIFGKK